MSKIIESEGIKKRKSVTFNDKITYILVPGRDEDRMGTWHMDAIRFKMRILEYPRQWAFDAELPIYYY